MNTRRAGSGRYRPSLNRGQLVEQPGHPVLLDIGDGDPVDTRCAAVCAHRDPTPATGRLCERPCPTARETVARDRPWPPGTAHAARHEPDPHGTTPAAAELAETALTGPLHRQQYASTKQRPFPHRRLCCPLGSSSTTAASDAHPARHPLPGLPVIGHAAPATPSAGHRAGEGLSSSRRHYRYVPRPIRRGVLGRLHFQVFTRLPWPSP